MGFQTRRYAGDGYGFAAMDEIEIHLGLVSDQDKRRGDAYLFVEDSEALAREWQSSGIDVHMPEDTGWGQHEGVVVDPDGNVIRFGSPVT
jgi:hypothetical protein